MDDSDDEKLREFRREMRTLQGQPWKQASLFLRTFATGLAIPTAAPPKPDDPRIEALESRVSSLEQRLREMAGSHLEVWQQLYLLSLRTMKGFEDDPEFVELRDLILRNDGGDAMRGFHEANLTDYLKRQGETN